MHLHYQLIGKCTFYFMRKISKNSSCTNNFIQFQDGAKFALYKTFELINLQFV